MGWLRRLRNTLLGSTVGDDFNEETRFHLDQRTEENLRRGMSDRDARAEAARRFGNVTLAHERTREADTLRKLDDLRQDLRYAVRMLRRSPGFAAVAILSLALGIGACTAIFSVIDALMLRMLPVRDPEQLVAFRIDDGTVKADVWYYVNHSYKNFTTLRDQTSVFTGLAAISLLDRSGVTV